LFRSPFCELRAWRAGGFGSYRDLGVALPRPAIVRNSADGTNSVANSGFVYHDAQRIGPRPALAFSPDSMNNIWLGGPGRVTGKVWLVFAGIQNDTQIKARGFGPNRTILAKPGAPAVMCLEAPAPVLFTRRGGFELIRLHSRTFEHNPAYNSFLVFAAFDPSDAALLLLDWYSPQAALGFLRDNGLFPAGDVFWDALLGIEGPVSLLTDRWERILAEADKTGAIPQYMSDGVPLEDWDAFARLRAPSEAFWPAVWQRADGETESLETAWSWIDALNIRLNQIKQKTSSP